MALDPFDDPAVLERTLALQENTKYFEDIYDRLPPEGRFGPYSKAEFREILDQRRRAINGAIALQFPHIIHEYVELTNAGIDPHQFAFLSGIRGDPIPGMASPIPTLDRFLTPPKTPPKETR